MSNTHKVSRRGHLKGAAALLGSGLLGALRAGRAGAQAGAVEVAQDLGDGTAQNWLVYPDGRRVPTGCRYSMETGECVGLGATEEIPGRPSAQLTREPVTLSLTTDGNNAQWNFQKWWIPRFTAQYPTVKIVQDTVAGGSWDRIVIAAAANTLTDVLGTTTSNGRVASLAYNKVFRPVEDLVKADEYDLGQYFPGAIEAHRFEGLLQALPASAGMDVPNLFYNMNMFDAAGLKYPDLTWTLDDLLETARKLIRREGDKVTQWGFGTGYNIDLLRRWGGDFLDAEGKKCLLDSPESIAAHQWVYDLANKHQVAPPDLGAAGGAAFRAGGGLGSSPFGTQAMHQGGSFQFAWSKDFAKNNVRMGITLLPPGPKGTYDGLLTVNTWALSRQVRDVPWGWEVLKYLTSTEPQVVGFLEFNMPIGSRPDAWTDPRMLASEYGTALKQQVDYVAPVTRPRPVAYNLRTPEVMSLYEGSPGIGTMLTTLEMAPRTALQALTKAIQGVLDRPR